MKFRCSACKVKSEKRFSACPSCKKWTTCVRIEGVRVLDAVGPTAIKDIEGGENYHRITTGTDEFDRVLAGGAVMGSVVLVSGPPGEGKSTLLLQMGCELADAIVEPQKVLYVSGEETVAQIKSRGTRICPESSSIFLCNETRIEKVIEFILDLDPDVVIIDSIQTMEDEELSAGNTIQQLKQCTKKLVSVTKSREITTFIVAQLNKDGDIAGPRAVEHDVDTVLQFASDNTGSSLRVLRATKNRFGDTGEVGVFQMVAGGLESVNDPSALLLRGKKAPPGSALSCMLISAGAGSAKRPMILEVQALVVPCGDAKAKRICTGYNEKRLEMILAILKKHCPPSVGLLSACDIYLNVSGGLKIEGDGLDLPVVMAMVSSLYEAPLPAGSVFWGEMGLLGEIRPENETAKRLKTCEAMKLLGHVCSKEDALLRIEDVCAILTPKPGSFAAMLTEPVEGPDESRIPPSEAAESPS